MPLRQSLGAIFFAAGLALGTGAPAQAQSQAQSRETVYVDLGRWTVFETSRPRTCVLRLRPENGATLAFSKTGAGTGSLTLQSNRRTSGFVGDIVWAFDDREFEGRMVARGTYAPVGNGTAIQSAFREARFLTVRHAGATVAQINLQTSSAGFRLLEQCSQEGFIGFSASRDSRTETPSSRPAVAARTSSAPPPRETRPSPPPASQPVTPDLSRGPVAINPGNWVRGDDRLLFPDRGGFGALAFTLIVSPNGRAEECIVNRSTGSRQLDGSVCRLLQRRARFEPALNRRGERTEGRYSSSIQFAEPQ